MGILGWIVLGLIAGAIAKLILPALAGNGAWTQSLAIALGALLGGWLCRNVPGEAATAWTLPYGRRAALAFAAAFAFGLALALCWPQTGDATPAAWTAAFYRAGALVFGGGHVVLPLLKHAIVDPGWVSPDTFLTGYGAAQAVPGPMFTLSSFLGKQMYGGQGGAAGALVGVLSIFLPGLLAVSGTLPFWRALAARDRAARMLAGVNAAVVGLLAAAFYDPVWVSAVADAGDFAIAAVGFVGLVAVRWPAWAVVIWCVGASLARHALA